MCETTTDLVEIGYPMSAMFHRKMSPFTEHSQKLSRGLFLSMFLTNLRPQPSDVTIKNFFGPTEWVNSGVQRKWIAT